MSTSNPTGDGWTCRSCGVYVFHGFAHYCPGSGVPTALDALTALAERAEELSEEDARDLAEIAAERAAELRMGC